MSQLPTNIGTICYLIPEEVDIKPFPNFFNLHGVTSEWTLIICHILNLKTFFLLVPPPPLPYVVGNIGCGDLKIESDKEPPAIKLYSQIRSGIRKLSVSHDTSRFQQTCLFCLTDYVVPTKCELSACCPVGFTTKLNTRTWNGVGLLLPAVHAVCASWTRCCCVYVRLGRSDVPLFLVANVSLS